MYQTKAVTSTSVIHKRFTPALETQLKQQEQEQEQEQQQQQQQQQQHNQACVHTHVLKI